MPGASDSSPGRDVWSRKCDFFMASISSAIGLGNLWRFPYQCFKNGGGAFLIPFLIMIVVTGFPLVLSDITIGQYSRRGPVKCWRAAPLMLGLGWTIFMLHKEADTYYAVIVSYTFFYTIASMAKRLPWDTCGNWWNTPGCRDTVRIALEKNCSLYNGTYQSGVCYPEQTSTLYTSTYLNSSNTYFNISNPYFNSSNVTSGDIYKPVSASDEYFHNYVLQISSGITDIGLPRWPVVLCLLLTLLVASLSLSFNIKSWGKMAYTFTLLPYLVLISLLIQGFFYEGSTLGVLYFLKPRWSELAKPKVWVDAVGQAFFSLGCSGGQQINIASHNPVRNNVVRDAIVITLADTMTSLLSGIVVFSVLGQMSYQLGVPIEEAVGKGAGLAFVVYPTALASMPMAPVWAVFFMLMLFNLGVGTSVSIIASDQATIMEELPEEIQRKKYTKAVTLLVVLLIFFSIGLIYTTNGGMYILQMMDNNITYILIVIGIYKIITMGWLYGTDRFFEDIRRMGGTKPWYPFAWVYKVVTPACLLFVLVFNLTDLKPLSYRDFVYPSWTEALGWVIAGLTMCIVPVVAIYLIITYPDRDLPILQRVKALCKPVKDWDPAELDIDPKEQEFLMMDEKPTV